MAPLAFDSAARLVRITPFGGKRGDGDVGALPRVQERDGAADAGIASRDEGDFLSSFPAGLYRGA